MPDTTANWNEQSNLYHDILFRFEKAFSESKNPNVADFLEGEGRLLTELLHSDLELRLRAGQDVRVKQYLDRFPELRQRLGQYPRHRSHLPVGYEPLT